MSVALFCQINLSFRICLVHGTMVCILFLKFDIKNIIIIIKT